MKCVNCNENIETVDCHYFTTDYDPVTLGAIFGVDAYYKIEIDCVSDGSGDELFFMTLPIDATALEFIDDEDRSDFEDCIQCPVCRKYPFIENLVESVSENVTIMFNGSGVGEPFI